MPEGETKPDKTEFSAAEIYKNYGHTIRRIIGAKVRDKGRVDDIFQDFFLSLVANPVRADVESVKSYLYKAVLNCVIEAGRNEEHQRAIRDRYIRDRGFVKRQERPEKPVIDADETRKMFRLIEAKLPPHEASVVLKVYKEGCEIGEMAKDMGMEERTVSRYVVSGINKIWELTTTNEGNRT